MTASMLLAWLAHLYTSLGLVCALFALLAVSEQRPVEVFSWLVAAFVIDATDGVLARRVEVTRYLPRFSGRKLDDIVDYLNYTFVPVCFIYAQGLLDGPWLGLLGFVLVASAYGFCSEAAKTSDGYFTGFPSYWNVVALYLYLLSPPQWASATVVVLLALMTFWPIRYLYPTRNARARAISIGGGAVWGAVCLWLLVWPDRPALWVAVSLLYPAWYMGFSFYLHFTTPRATAGGDARV